MDPFAKVEAGAPALYTPAALRVGDVLLGVGGTHVRIDRINVLPSPQHVYVNPSCDYTLYILYTPFIHPLYTCVHPLYMYKYTIYTPYIHRTHPLSTLYTPVYTPSNNLFRYNMTVAGSHCFFAGGVLGHNMQIFVKVGVLGVCVRLCKAE